MKIFTPAFLLCVSALSIKSTAAVYNHGHPLFMNTKMQSSESRDVRKRQIEVNQLRVCQGIVFEEQCTSGLAQLGVNLSVECNSNEAAETINRGCQSNSDGFYCALAFSYLFNDIGTIVTECAMSVSTCTARCRNLLVLIRSELGCCISTMFKNSASAIYNPQPFRDALWRSCEVDLITEPCPPSTIVVPQLPVDPTCTPNTFAKRAGMLNCRRQFLQPIIDALLAEGTCMLYAQGALEGCGVDEAGRPCYERAQELSQSFSAAQNACQSLIACNQTCREALQSFADAGGCCINNLFNNSLSGITNIRYGWMSSLFWANCGVETPSICEPRLTGPTATATPNGGPSLLPSSALAAIATAVAVLVSKTVTI